MTSPALNSSLFGQPAVFPPTTIPPTTTTIATIPPGGAIVDPRLGNSNICLMVMTCINGVMSGAYCGQIGTHCSANYTILGDGSCRCN
jgi:hypothetical protein